MIDLSYFMKSGIHHFSSGVDQGKSKELLKKINEFRRFGSCIFMDEAAFKENPQFKGVNPMPGRNLAETLSESTLYIDHDDSVIQNITAVLGVGYKIMDKKFVCGVPQEWIPEWVRQYIAETGVKNLGPYIKPEYRDITYFSGIDFRQDIIDWPEMGPHFITMYVYLDDVGLHDAPLHVIPETHLFGATTFPHELEITGEGIWKYTNRVGDSGNFKHKLLTGKCGDVSLWHPFVLHGTQPDTNSKPRISLRYLIQVADPQENIECGLHELNKKIHGSMSLKSTRNDLNKTGEAVLKGNHVNKIQY